MFAHLIPDINNDLKRTKKAIISIGCSFVQGQGAIDDEIYNNYKWEMDEFGRMDWKLTDNERQKLVEEYPDILLYSNLPDLAWPLDFSTHEYNNSFVNVLAKHYLNGEYTSINLGRRANGNRASIKDLYFYPDIAWDVIEEIIVIYCPSGAERVDFMDDQFHQVNGHPRWTTAWPNIIDNNKGSRNKLWTGIKESVNSDKFQVLEQIAHVQELMLWCKYKNAKLIITPAFMQTQYTREWFEDSLRQQIERDDVKGLQKIERLDPSDKSIDKTVDMWPWENMFYPDNAPTFMDYALQHEYGTWKQAPHFYALMGKGSPNLWVTPCAHPGKKAHDAFAKVLYNYIREKL